MAISELMPFLDFGDLENFYLLNKTCKAILTPADPKCLRFDVLFEKGTRKDELWDDDLLEYLANASDNALYRAEQRAEE